MNIETARLHRRALPQMSGLPFLTDGGIETTLIFHDGIDLPYFAAFVLLEDETGREVLRRYYRRYMSIASEAGAGFILESPTWRCSPDWGGKLGYDAADIARLNRESIALMADLRDTSAAGGSVVISGCVGPRGDGYAPDAQMGPDEAAAYHDAQVSAFRDTAADMVTAITMTHVGEATGVVRAARAHGLPCAISFTVETDGRLPSGETLIDAIAATDDATDGYAAYYMINCAHPDHFAGVVAGAAPLRRIRGIRANASRMSHAELDESEVLDDGDPEELGRDYRALVDRLPEISIFGGCCGTDHRHLAAIARNCCG